MSLHPRHPRQPSLFLLTTIWHYSDSHRTVTSSLQKLKKCQNFAYNLHRYHPYSQCAQDDFEIDKRNLARKVEVMKGRAVDLVQLLAIRFIGERLPAELVGMIRGEFEFEDEDEELVEDVRAIAVGLRKEGEGAGSEMEEEVYSESEYDEEEDSEGDSDEDEEEDSEEVEGEEDEEVVFLGSNTVSHR